MKKGEGTRCGGKEHRSEVGMEGGGCIGKGYWYRNLYQSFIRVRKKVEMERGIEGQSGVRNAPLRPPPPSLPPYGSARYTNTHTVTV